MLKIWASSSILDSIISGFWQFCIFHEATEYHFVKFERNLSRATELERCNRFSNCGTLGTPSGQMDLRAGRPYCTCTRSAADQSTDIGAVLCCFRFLNFCSIFRSQRSGCEWGRKTGQNFALLTPYEKREDWWRCLYELFVTHIGSDWAPVYFLPGDNRRFGHIKCGWLKKKIHG